MSTSTGWTMEYILDLDLETFNELLESVLRNEYHQKIEATWTAFIAAQAPHKEVKKWTGQWSKILRGGASSAEKDKQDGNLNEFLKIFGGGF